jgi:predicted ABC-type ATPase
MFSPPARRFTWMLAEWWGFSIQPDSLMIVDASFETTLGGNTIPALLEEAMAVGIEVLVRYVGLDSVDLHIARVRAGVARGGHDIPEGKIRERFAPTSSIRTGP